MTRGPLVALIILVGFVIWIFSMPACSVFVNKEFQVDRMSGNLRVVGKAFGLTTRIKPADPLWISRYATETSDSDWVIYGRDNGLRGARENWTWGRVTGHAHQFQQQAEFYEYPEPVRAVFARRMLAVLGTSDKPRDPAEITRIVVDELSLADEDVPTAEQINALFDSAIRSTAN